jgi:hypothetical protein
MKLDDLVAALLDGDSLTARQWVSDARRSRINWVTIPEPTGLSETGKAIAAGVAELLASRAGQAAPAWAAAVPAAPEPFFLVRSAKTLPNLKRLCEEEGPEPLRRRRLLAPPEFLTAA